MDQDRAVAGTPALRVGGYRRDRRDFLRRAAQAGAALVGLLLVGDVAPAAAAQTSLSPDELYYRLLSTRFEDRELPAGFTILPAYQSTATVVQTSPSLPGAIGGGLVTLRGPDLQNVIWYYVFGSEAEALDQFENGTFGRRTTVPGPSDDSSQGQPVTITEVYEPDGFTVPASCVAGKTGYWGWTSCRALAGMVLVVGYSKVMPGTGADRGNDAVAIALAQAGLGHLQRLG
jgi:hypothetical protein